MQKYIRDQKMAGRFYKSDNCYNREEDERFRMRRPQNNQSDRTCIKNNVKTSEEETREKSQILDGKYSLDSGRGSIISNEIHV